MKPPTGERSLIASGTTPQEKPMSLSTTTRDLLAFLSRALMALLFLPEGIGKITDFAGTVQYIAQYHVPLPELAAVIGIVVEVGLVSLLLVGYQTRWVALAIIVFVMVITFVFHPYWSVPAAQVFDQKFNFYKNFAIAGGLCSILAWGPGSWSLDSWRGAASPVSQVPAPQ
jgi:putative oxidoreductase